MLEFDWLRVFHGALELQILMSEFFHLYRVKEEFLFCNSRRRFERHREWKSYATKKKKPFAFGKPCKMAVPPWAELNASLAPMSIFPPYFIIAKLPSEDTKPESHFYFRTILPSFPNFISISWSYISSRF